MKLIKKAELSINMIVIVAICIVVLVVVIYLVIQQSGRGGDAVSCPSLGGLCVPNLRCQPYQDLDPNACKVVGEVCCPIPNVRSS